MADPVITPVEPVVPVVPAVEPVVPPVVEPIIPVIPEPVAPVVPVVEPKPAPASTGNEYFDNVQTALHEKGLDAARYMQEIATSGNISAESRAELVATIGEAQVKIIEQGTVGEINKLATAQQVEAQKVYDAIKVPGFADGKAAFSAMAEWGKSNLSAEERSTLNEMLSKGGVQANLAIKSIQEKYMTDPNFTASANLVPGTTVPVGAGPEPISRATYTTERRKAENARDKVAIAKLDERAKHTMANNPAAWRP